MAQMEEITTKIENYRMCLQNLIANKKSLIDFEIVELSQKLDRQLNIYHGYVSTRN